MSRATFRLLERVLGWRATAPVGVLITPSSILTVPAVRSRSFHRTAQATPLRIPVAGGHAGRAATLEEARIEDIEAATRALTKKSVAPTSSAERALKEAFAKHPALRGVRVRVRGGLVNVLGVPAASIGVFGEVLQTAKWGASGGIQRGAETVRGGEKTRARGKR